MRCTSNRWLQFGVAITCIGVRFLAPGWLFACMIYSFGIIPLLMLSPLLGAAMIRPRNRRLSSHVTTAFIATDLALLTCALTCPDFGDAADSVAVPLVTLTRGGGTAISSQAAAPFMTVAMYSFLTYIGLAVLTLILALADSYRASNGERASRRPTGAGRASRQVPTAG